jgi:large subunit ribosomal protein L18
MNLQKKKLLAQKRRWRIRKKISGTAVRPRVAIRFTNKNVHAQCIDDENSNTLVSISTNEPDFKSSLPNTSGSQIVGVEFGKRIKKAGIETIVFDRSGRKYHGCVKAFAEALREQGLQF